MDKKIRRISQDIQNGKLLEENIPQIFNNLADHYHILAQVRLAMHYFTFYEEYYDDENTWSAEAGTVISTINQLIYDNILQSKSGEVLEKAIRELDAIRGDIMNRMNALTAFADIFQNYEYILNRLEYRFKEETISVDEEEFSKEVLRFIFDSEDNLIINEKIKEIIGQLPIRITKQKYFEILKDSLGAYLGADGTSFDAYLYMLRTSAMLYSLDDMETLYPTLWEKKEYLSHLEYKDITKENYEKAVSILRAATLNLETETTVYYGLQEIINEVYALLLCSPYSGMVASDNDKAEKAAVSIIRDINEIFLTNEKKDILDDLMDQFSDLEGVQEELSFEIDMMENAFYEIGKNHKALAESLMLNHIFHVLKRSQSLLSNSLFVDFKEEKEEITVDENRITQEAEALEKELTALF
ncbi:MAG: hypothetical protein PHF63_08205, partial [Herbinix sp.]|nr:hypothetical protein [Herbinix sp.]